MNEVLQNIKSRRSIRAFKEEMPLRGAVEKVIEAGLCAANGMNNQSPIILAVTNPAIRAKLAETNAEIGGWKQGFDPFYGAPVILVVLANKAFPTAIYDGSLTLGNMMLAAHTQGLGSCWIHRAKETFEMPQWKAWLQSLGVEGEYVGVGHLALGYADGEYPAEIPRKDGRVFFAE